MAGAAQAPITHNCSSRLPDRVALRRERPTMAAIEAAAGAKFLLPAALLGCEYLSRRLPHFSALGTCRQALDHMVTAWDIADAVWFALPDGRFF